MKTSELKEKLIGFDMVSKNRAGNFVARRGFYYTMGESVEKCVDKIKEQFPAATIINSGEKYAPFRGGDGVAKGSHWWVEFNFNSAGPTL